MHASGNAVSAAEAARSADDVMPIRQIVLYRSGVGFYERRGEVDGDATVSLRFNTEDVNDILKSLLVQDMGGGSVGTVSYTARESLENRLAGLEIDVLKVGSTADLLKQLRGAEIDVLAMGSSLTGTILAIENRMSVVETEGAVGHFQEPHVTLVTKSGIRTIAISAISTFRLTDERLNDELNRALAAISSSRSENTKVIDLALNGPDGSGREVRASYVHATPVWKTSYRMVIPDDGGEPYLQGWAIVENTSDADWDGVRLSLASGQPVSFVMDLYEPLHVSRPTVPVPFVAGLAMRVYEGGRAMASQIAPSPRRWSEHGVPGAGVRMRWRIWRRWNLTRSPVCRRRSSASRTAPRAPRSASSSSTASMPR